MRDRSDRRTVGRSRQPLMLMLCVSALLFGGLAHRLFYLQLVKGETFRKQADSNRIQTIPKPPGRGSILDREQRLLAGSQLTRSVSVWRTSLSRPDWPQVRQILATALDMSEAEIQEKVDHVDYESRFLTRVAANVPPEKVTQILEYGEVVQGVQIDLDTSRYYPQGESAAHVVGYVGEISGEELESDRFKKRKDKGYRAGDIVGKMGIERALEFDLRGEPGKEKVEIDGRGNLLKILDDQPSSSGNDLTLTLDLDVQKAAENALKGINGAVVALDPNNGEVLALASQPAFDPNLFVSRIDEKTWAELQKLKNPFLNRALRGYPPASTFKVVTTVAGVESGKVQPGAVLPTYPYLRVEGTQIWDWNKSGFGSITFQTAMAWSSNTFFGQVGMRAGQDVLLNWTRKFGFGRPSGIELEAEESKGLVPNDEWKREIGQGPWNRVDTVNTSMGQGFLQATPLQVAVMFAAVANGGDLVRPHLIQDGRSPQAYRTSLNLKPSTLQLLRQSLRQVVTSGTGKALNGGIPPAAGKSGTAEDPPRETHAWFGGYAPFDKPEIVVVAFAENSGGGGGSVSGPIVREVMAAYFAKKQQKQAQASPQRSAETAPVELGAAIALPNSIPLSSGEDTSGPQPVTPAANPPAGLLGR